MGPWGIVMVEMFVALICAGLVLLGLYGARQAEVAGHAALWCAISAITSIIVLWVTGYAGYP